MEWNFMELRDRLNYDEQRRLNILADLQSKSDEIGNDDIVCGFNKVFDIIAACEFVKYAFLSIAGKYYDRFEEDGNPEAYIGGTKFTVAIETLEKLGEAQEFALKCLKGGYDDDCIEE